MPPMRLAMKPGVSLQWTTPLPSATSQNSSMVGDRVGARLRPGDDLQQPHVARRIEEMRDEEIALEALGHAPARSFSGIVEVLEETIEPGLAHRLDLAIESPA